MGTRNQHTFGSGNQPVTRRGKAAYTKLKAALDAEGLSEEDIIRIWVLVGLGNEVVDPRADERGNRAFAIDFQNVSKIVDKIVPSVKPAGERVKFKFDINASIPDKVDQILDAAAQGHISPETAQIFINSIAAQVKIEEQTTFQEKVIKLAERMGIE